MAGQRQYLADVAAREEAERQVFPEARYAGHDPDSGLTWVAIAGGGFTQLMNFSSAAPKAGELGRSLGVGFDVGQVFYEEPDIAQPVPTGDCVVGTWELTSGGGGGGGGGPVG